MDRSLEVNIVLKSFTMPNEMRLACIHRCAILSNSPTTWQLRTADPDSVALLGEA